MRTARDKKQYELAWTLHINELATLALAADIPYNEWSAAKQRMLQWLDKACERDFPNNTTED